MYECILYLRPDWSSGSTQTAVRVCSNRQEGNSTSHMRRQTSWNLARWGKVITCHRVGGGVGGCSSGIVCCKKIMGSELSECRRTHTNTLFEYPLGKPSEVKLLLKERGWFSSKQAGTFFRLREAITRPHANNTWYKTIMCALVYSWSAGEAFRSQASKGTRLLQLKTSGYVFSSAGGNHTSSR